MALHKDDTFPLWSFGYRTPPVHDKKQKIMTSRGRTWEEAWTLIQETTRSFLEPEKVGLLASVQLQQKEVYDERHPYDWFRDAPLWLKKQENALDQIW